ncbi:SCO family protein [marine bacterium AO1-C]|nr:SCO family protein [marine bacterium AO1-C]
MKRFNKKNNILMVLITLLFWGCDQKTTQQSRVTRLPYYNEASFKPHWLEANDKKLRNFHKVSPFKLTNQDGKIVTEKTFEGKIYVADFFFTTCPGICPIMTKNMAVLQDEFSGDSEVLLLSHSVTPEKDQVSILKTYAKRKGVESGKWHLVTGTKQGIYKLGRQDYFVEEDLGEANTNEEDFLHTENFILVDRNRHIRGVYNGLNKTSIKQLIADIKTLKKEK